MAEKDLKDQNIAADQRPRPSQAEGEEVLEESKDTRPVPSQAEGEDKKA